MSGMFDWLEQRTGVLSLMRHLLFESIPGGPRWRYVWGSTLLCTFAVQAVTGVLLMTAYSPSATTAWGSVWYIQTQMTAGWFIRGLHHFGAQAMVVLLVLHMVQVVWAKAYRPPREFNWWIGLALLGLTLGLGLTGYLLPWDQKGYWATQVATNIAGSTPWIGNTLQRLLVGGGEYGHATLTRFYTLHVWVLPTLMVMLIVIHLALFRRHGVTVAPGHAEASAVPFWPGQAARDLAACAAVLAVIVGLTFYMRYIAQAALLDAPADPADADYPARPEWYFLSLFQMLKYFKGPLDLVGKFVIPTAVLVLLALFPLLHHALGRRLAGAFATAATLILVAVAVLLTLLAYYDDHLPPAELMVRIHARPPDTPLTAREQAALRAEQFHVRRAQADRAAARALHLAALQFIPPEGPLALMARDPHTRGPVLFAAHCAACHRINGHDGLGAVPHDPPTSSDLGAFASVAWIRGLLQNPMDARYFGLMKKPDGTPAHTRMKRWRDEQDEEYPDEAGQAELARLLDDAAAFLAYEADHPGSADEGAALPEHLHPGRLVFTTTCMECHSYGGRRFGTSRAPEMRGYGSPEWIEQMIADPAHPSRYGSTGREPAQMPAFDARLSQSDRALLAQWLAEIRQNQVPNPLLP